MVPAPFPADEANRIATLRNYDILDSDPEKAFDSITKYIAKQFDVDIALVSLVDTDRQWFKSACGINETQTPRDLAFCGYTILSHNVHYVPDASKDQRLKANPLVTGSPKIRFYCGAPLIAPNGQSIGSLCVIDSKPRHAFSPDHQALLQDMAAMVMDQMEMRKAAGKVATEIETRIRAEEKAKLSERRISAFVEHAPVGIALVGPDGSYLGRSKRWQDFQDKKFSSDVSENFLDSIQGHRHSWTKAFKTALGGVQVVCDEDQLTMLDGSTEYAKWEMQPWLNDDNGVEGVFLSLSLITSQVEARKQAERQNELFNAVLENVREGIVACDETGRLTLFNSQTRMMHGLDVTDTPLEECGDFYSLFEADGVTPLQPERIPLLRAFKGEKVVDEEMVIAPMNLPPRDLVTQACPLFGPDGQLIGAVASMADVTASKAATRKLKDSEARAVHIAFHDTLTGLANRAKFNDHCQSFDAHSQTKTTAALFVDLNRFKLINDTLGHKAGDDLLKRAADILTSIAGENAFVARIGGDEFVALLPVHDMPHACSLGRELFEALSSPTIINGQTVVTSASVGIAMSPEHGDRFEELVSRANIAMHRAKHNAQDGPVMFDPVFEFETVQRNQLELELVKSIENDELHVYFQPIVCAKTQQIRGAEALVRWQHPTRGLVPPDQFISIAEECGFIVELGEWVLKTAVAQMTAYDGLFLSVNLSPVQFRDPELVEKVLCVLDETGFCPRRLELEITEGLLINDTKNARRVIDAFKAKGISIALDDFGTGYSSLSYIQDFPFDKVKIDRSFISQLGESVESAAVVQCVVSLASSLGMVVTAEGVESEQHEMLLKFIGCGTLQGFRYGKPSPISDLSGQFVLNLAHVAA